MLRRITLAFSVALAASLLLAAADLKISIREWDVPTPKSRPHDPAVGPDGSLWYTGQLANKLGRLDPQTGAIKEFPLKTAGSGPHGLAPDKEGNIWFTANFKAYIGKLDPKTGTVTEYPMPDPAAADPHTPVFDRNGTLWFTVQGGNFVGKVDPATGKVTLLKVATPNSHPYGMIVDPQGFPVFCEFFSNKIGRINPKTLEITEYVLPEGARPRRIAMTPKGAIYYTDYARGYLGLLDTKTGKVEEWPSPGGRKSQPYGITSTPDGIVWYSESGIEPNTVVRFDPQTRSLQSWPIPSGGGVVRNMAATPDGRIYLACSGVNKVGVVEVSR